MTDFAKVEANKMDLEIQPFRLGAVLDSLRRLTSSLSDQRNLKIKVEVLSLF